MDRPRQRPRHLDPCACLAEGIRSRWINLALILVLAQTVGFYGCVGTTGAQLPDPVTEPRLSANPNNVNFGNVGVGGSAAQSIALNNSGTANLTVSQALVSGTGFSVSGLSTPMTLPPGQGTTFSVRFAPQAAGSATGSISLSSNASGSPASIPLAGNGMASPPTLQLNLSPPSISFGNVTVGNSSTQTATLSNTGSGTVAVSAASASGTGFSLNGLPLPLSLPAGQTANFNVVFAPAAPGSVSGGVTITSNASNSPATSTLSGAGVPPATAQLTVDPTSVDFGQILVGSNSSRTITLTSSGTASVTISQATVTGAGAGFSISGLSTPLTLPPGQTSTFSVRFAPQAPGGVTGSISLRSNAPDSPANVALAGTGIAATFLLTANPTSLSFGDVVIGSSGTQTVMLTNSGNSSVTVSQINVSSPAFSTTGLTPPMTLAAGQTTALTVVFTPSSPGSVRGSIAVVSNATNSPATIAVSGSGVPPVAHSVSLTWDPSTTAGVGYNVYRGTQSGGPYTKLNSSPVLVTTYTDSTVQAGQTYFYVVTAVDSTGESEFSNEVSATIPVP